MSSTRRTFLKVGGLAAVAGPVGVRAEGQAASRKAAEASAGVAAPGERVRRINVFQGTESTPTFSRGNTLPIAAMPFGMAHWTLQSQSRGGTPWMFAPGERRIEGFRSTHQLSPWLGDYGQAVFLPFSGEVSTDAGARGASYRPEEARMSPAGFRMELIRYRATAELVPTERCCVLETSFAENAAVAKAPERGLLMEVPVEGAAMEADAGARTIRFQSTANEGGVPQGFATYYLLKFDQPWSGFAVKHEKGRTVGVARFAAKAGAPLRVEIATSFISYDQAAENLRREIGTRSTAEVRESAERVWEEHLGRLVVEGGTTSQQRIFDSCLYRALLFPRTWHEIDASGKTVHRSAYTGAVAPGVMYADHGYWDVYRAWYPFMSVCFPERLGEILEAWVNAYKEGGWLPQFPAPGYRACMTGSLIDSVFGDAAAKGIKGFDLAAAYDGLRKHATTPGDPDKGYGRRGIEAYLKYGYCPAGIVDQSCAETVDAAYGDFCIGVVAKAVGKDADAAMFAKRSGAWQALFDPKTKFLRGKHEDGRWLEPFDPVRWGDPYVEGSAWQHRFDVPHDVPGMMAAYGGPETMAKAIEEMLTRAADFEIGVYGREIHEMSEMAAVPFGQYAHSNQPVHHVLYLFAATGRPDRMQFWVRRTLTELYHEDRFAGDEDTGSMAAWYLLSSMGFYPVCPGKAEYTLGSPLWDRATIRVPGRKPVVIEAQGQSAEAMYVSSVTVNGQPAPGGMLPHAVLVEGAAVRFVMSATPGRRAG